MPYIEMSQISEQWIAVEGWPRYHVSDKGRVKNVETGIIIKPVNRGGYHRVGLRKPGERKHHETLHRLVAKHFIPNPENLSQVDHINHDKSNNTKENIRWCTASENTSNRRVRKTSKGAPRIGFKGVSKASSGRWLAVITVNNVDQYLGMFNTPGEAQREYDKAAKRIQGNFALTNLEQFGEEGVAEIERELLKDGVYTPKQYTSKYPGVTRNRSKWRATIRLNGKDVHLGSFAVEEDARDARNEAVKANNLKPLRWDKENSASAE